MARKGYRVITLKEEIYLELKEQFDNNKARLLKNGVTTFGGYLVYLANCEAKKITA